MRKPGTLRGRLVLSAVVTSAIAVIVLTSLLAFLLDQRLTAEARSVLRDRAAAAASTVSVSAAGRLVVGDGVRDAALDTGVWIYDGTMLVDGPPRASGLEPQARRLVGTDGVFAEDDTSSTTEFLSIGVLLGHRQVGTLVAALSLEPYERSVRTTTLGAAGLGALLLVVVVVVAGRVAGRAIEPVTAMTRQAADWSVADPAHRFGVEDRPGELRELAMTLNGLLDRQSAVLRREQQLSAELSHELRTPLAGITAEAHLFLSRPRSMEEAVRAVTTVAEAARRLQLILDTLLAAARGEGTPLTGRCDPIEVARRFGVEVVGVGEVPHVGCSAALLERILSPLLDNAGRYGSVRVLAKALPGSVQLEVVDDGPGIPAGREEDVFEPGTRLIPSDDHDGAGLGLALSRRLARTTGGEVSARPGPGGHLLITLPRA